MVSNPSSSSTVLMSSRKRPHTDEEERSMAKKRLFTDPSGSPNPNGLASEQDDREPLNGDNLELFRKEAIFRRMKHYSRENERCQARIAELERRKNTCEAGLAAISACWTQLVETIRVLVRPENLPTPSDTGQDLFDIAAYIQHEPHDRLVTALEDNAKITQTLVTKFVQLGGDSQLNFLQNRSFSDCQRAQTECVALRSQLNIMNAQLEETKSERDKYSVALVAAESRADRLQSRTVMAMQARRGADNKDASGGGDAEPQPTSPVHAASLVLQNNGAQDTFEIEVLRDTVKSRDRRIDQLEQEAAVLRDQKTQLELQAKAPSGEELAKNPHYKVLLDHAAYLEGVGKESRERIDHLTDELHQAQISRKEWEDNHLSLSNQCIHDLKSMLAKRDTDNSRLREQRDQQLSELNERKQKDQVKMASLQEFKSLAESRSERIVVLESALSRYGAQLAAHANDEDIMQFFAEGNSDIGEYTEHLKARVTIAENRSAALQQTFLIFQDDHPNVVAHMKAEAEALERLAEATTQLQKYQSIYGDLAAQESTVAALAAQLEEKEHDLCRLRLLDTQRTQSETSLYAEIDKLSTAWEGLDRQLNSKVFDLTNMEERLQKAGLDKAKSENKFYAAMRDKEAIEVERKNLVRNNEKQAKVLDRMVESEKNAKSRVYAMETEMTHIRKLLDDSQENIEQLASTNNKLKAHLEAEKARTGELRALIEERERALELRKADFRKIEDAFARSKKEAERQAAKLKEVASMTSKGGSASSEDELMAVLKCSTCKLHFRDMVITKCMHTFCKSCVDSRISTRQRKCPACNVAFSASEALPIYFQ
ncbi:hypothetical protein BD779DRAFT_1797962 [Infundibulicybe gibba]|nr:hypothetical protein BD779DRAFT_1797962 [Infundibulicybe gibba]